MRPTYDFSEVAQIVHQTFASPTCPPVDGPLPPRWVDILQHEAMAALETWAQARYEDKHDMVRAYAGTSLDFALHEQVLTTSENLLSWVQSQSSERPVTIQISDINTWNDRLSYLFALLRAALEPSLSYFAHDFRLGLFIGTGGHTPFGIHADGLDKTLFHVPLVGSGKTLYFQSSDAYFQTHGHRRPMIDVPAGLPAMTPIPMQRGKFVFFRGDWFHVATYDAVSMSLILNIKRDGIQNLRSRIQSQPVFRDCVRRTAEHLCQPGKDTNDNAFTNLGSVAQTATRIQKQMQSAAGFLPSRPKPNRAKGTISRIAPFPIFVEPSSDTTRIIARGHMAELPLDPKTQHAVDHLNADEPVSLGALGQTQQQARAVAKFLLAVGAVQ